MCEIEWLVKREEREGVHWYLVKWVNAEPGEKFSWVPAVALAGAATWKAALDRYYDEVLGEKPDLTIQQWLRQDVEMTTMGDNHQQQAHIKEFEEREMMNPIAQGGLRTEQVQRLFEFLISKGWRVHLKPNAYGVGGDKPGPAGILLAVGMKPGIYLVATLDNLYRGHCFVTEVGENMMALACENGIEMGLGEYKYAEKICWIRECAIVNGVGQCKEGEGVKGADPWQAAMFRAPLARKPAKQRKPAKLRRRKRMKTTTG
ncbi:unnamed protein product [Peronospora destructor]|uniref:Chromo domain-containing protein n=1 Tax=Peronospora destructor TaxID=86335 RepID=A0AAV0T2Y8_9STRA|nr:unnamed protein product [Peronospora destructor]